MKRSLWAPLVLACLFLVPEAQATKRTVVLVADLTPAGVKPEEAATISDLLRNELAMQRKLLLVSRGDMDKIAKEQEFQASGCTDQACAVKLGEMLNAETVILGKVSRIMGRLLVSAQMVDMARNDIEFAEEVNCSDDFAAMRAAVTELATKLSSHVPVLAEVTDKVGEEFVLDGGTRDGIEVGARYPVSRVYLRKNAKGETVLEERRDVGEVEILYADAKASKARLASGEGTLGDAVRVQASTVEQLGEREKEAERALEVAKKAKGDAAERQRAVKAAQDKLDALKRDLAAKQGEREKEAAALLAKTEEEARRRSQDQSGKLAELKKKAEALRGQGNASALTLTAAAAEVDRLQQAAQDVKAAYDGEVEKQLAPLKPVYEARIAAARKVEPCDTQFDTQADCNARAAEAEGKAKALEGEWARKRSDLVGATEAERDREVEALKAKAQGLLEATYGVGPEEVRWKFREYDKDWEAFRLELSGPLAPAVPAGMEARVPVPRQKAKLYWQNPDLLLYAAKLTVGPDGKARAGEGFLKDPEGAEYPLVVPKPPVRDAVTGMEFVCVERGFCLGKTEVTQAQWEKVMGSNPSKLKGADRPVERVSWNDAQEFIQKLNAKTGEKYRLPTEAEWEWAAKSGGKNEEWAGTSNESELGDYAWYRANSGSQTHPVATKKPNGLGLYDMSGNVWEWVEDAIVSSRVFRGGGWYNEAGLVRATDRNSLDPSYRFNYLGFRLALSSQ